MFSTDVLSDSSDHWHNFTEIPPDADTSQFPFPTVIWKVRPVWEVSLKVTTIAPITLLGLIGNASLIYAILCNKLLHTTTNLLILNMAIADFCTSFFCPGMFIFVDIYQNYMFGKLGCKFDGFLLQAMTLIAVFSLSAISYDRVSAIVLNCSGKLSIRSARYLIFVSWAIALAVATPLACFRTYYERQWKNYIEMFCTETKTTYPYWHIFVGISVWIPLTIMAICYSTILIKLDRYEAQALKSKHPIVVKYKGKVTRILALVVLAFIICRVPFTALVIQRARMRNADEIKVGQASSMYVLWYTSKYLVFVNAALNPLLYGCTSGSLRQELASHPPLSWIMPKKKNLLKSFNQSQLPPKRLNTLKPRSPCIRMDDVPDIKEPIPNISSIIQSKSLNIKSESKLYKKFRINSIIR